ncbi:MAG: hypothetical protein AAF721_21575, partial [Myxococcota bacterium]
YYVIPKRRGRRRGMRCIACDGHDLQIDPAARRYRCRDCGYEGGLDGGGSLSPEQLAAATSGRDAAFDAVGRMSGL